MSQQTVSPTRIHRHIQGRWNPLRGITPQRVTDWLQQYRAGYYYEAAWAMEIIEQTDYSIKTVAMKRKSAIARLEWDIVALDGAPERFGNQTVEQQRQFLLDFYNQLSCSSALDRDQQGGLSLLIRQMMDAVGKKYACHEIEWHPNKDGTLGATFWQAPLWFFENTTGRLRYLQHEGAYQGQDLDPQSWMITHGEGLMLSCLPVYIFKTLPLKDWLAYSETFGGKSVVGKTDARPDSPEWNQAQEMLEQFASNMIGLCSNDAEISVQDLNASGQLPYPKLVEKMERALASLWRGGDLSTMSGQAQLGASLQQSESDILEQDDVAMINETLQHPTKIALQWKYGKDCPIAVSFKLKAPDRLDEKSELQKLQSLVAMGLPISQEWVAEKFGIPLVTDDSTKVLTLENPPKATAISTANAQEDEDADYLEQANQQLSQALAKALSPLRKHLEGLLDTDPDQLLSAVEHLDKNLPKLKETIINQRVTQQVLQDILASAYVNGASQAKRNENG